MSEHRTRVSASAEGRGPAAPVKVEPTSRPHEGAADGDGVAARLFLAVATPQVLCALLLLVGTLALLLSVPRNAPPPRVSIDLSAPSAPLRDQKVRLVVVDEVGQERVREVSLALPEGAAGRIGRVLTALRDASMQQGVWPAELPAPAVFVRGEGRSAVAVIDMQLDGPVGVGVEQELALLRSLTATALQNGVAEVRFLRNGRPTDTLLGHVAVPSAL